MHWHISRNSLSTRSWRGEAQRQNSITKSVWKRECLERVGGHPLRIVWISQVRWRRRSLKCKGGIMHPLGLIGSLELRVCCLYDEEPINQMHTKQPAPCKHVGHTYVALGSTHTTQCNFALSDQHSKKYIHGHKTTSTSIVFSRQAPSNSPWSVWTNYPAPIKYKLNIFTC